MSKTLSVPRPSVRHVLTRILDEPALVAQVRSLPATALTKLIDHIGLEDAGEIVALATTEQIASVFDEDLWTRDDAFDAGRFSVWLEILLEAGERVAARRLAELDPDTITFAFHQLAHVAITDDLGVDDELEDIERVLESALTVEIGEYMVIARTHGGWDAIVQALTALDEVDHDACTRLLDRLAALTSRAADEDGLYEVLSEAESLAEDVVGDRNERRAKSGFIAASDARAFLRLAKEHEPAGERDAVTKAYFRELDRSPRAPVAPSRLMKELDKAGITREAKKPKALGRSALFDALQNLSPERQTELMEELAYLVNVLMAGDKRHWRPADAAEKVVAVVEAGSSDLDLAKDSLVHAFRIGIRQGKLD
jgi:hypothetical protein